MLELSTHRQLAFETHVPQGGGEVATLRYGVQYLPDIAASDLNLFPFGMTLVLSETDYTDLANPSNEGIYVRREYAGENGKLIRFVAYIEKDMKSKKDKKQKKHKNRKDASDAANVETLLRQPEVNEL